MAGSAPNRGSGTATPARYPVDLRKRGWVAGSAIPSETLENAVWSPSVPLLAATATGTPVPVWLLAGVGLLVWALVYAVSCWLWPFAHCPRCGGSGKRSRDDGRVFRLCRRCSGSGRRLRLGRRGWNAMQSRRKAAR